MDIKIPDNKQVIEEEEENTQSLLRRKELEQARFLIAESEKELQSLFKAYLDPIGAESEIVEDDNRVLSTYLRIKDEGKGYDAIVVDTHLKGENGLDVAKKIRKSDNSQKNNLGNNQYEGAAIQGGVAICFDRRKRYPCDAICTF